MASAFTNAGEFSRGKGSKGNRLGPRQRASDSVRRGNRQTQTPNDIALRRLDTILSNKGMDDKNRREYQDIMRRGDQLRFMNMTVLAQVLIYMHSINNDFDAIEERGIKNNVDQLLKSRVSDLELKPRGSADDNRIYTLRLAATFLRYISYINSIMMDADVEATEAESDMTGTLAPEHY